MCCGREAPPWHEDLEDPPADLFGFDAADGGVQQGAEQQVGVGHEVMNEGRIMFARAMNHRQASRGDVQDEDHQDVGPAVVQKLEMLLLGCSALNCLINHHI